jgi:5-methylcytosine-specific restriction endonuclease McrA
MQPSSHEQDSRIFERAVSLLLSGDRDKASAALRTFSNRDPMRRPAFVRTVIIERGEPQPKVSVSNAIRAKVYARDGWRCRYCERELVIPGVMLLLTTLCQEFLGLLPGHHMPYHKTERAVERVYPNVDHVHAVAAGGAWLDEDNLVTACTPCNTAKNDFAGWTPGPVVRDEWDGLTSRYRPLAELDGPASSYHLAWFKILETI